MTTPKQTKKVLFLITKSNWGGAQRYVYDLATNLDRQVWEPVVALGGNGTLVEMLHHAGIRTIPLSDLERDINLKKEWRFAITLWRLLREEQPAVFHINSSKAGGVGALVGRLARVPRIIFTAHGWAFNEDRPGWQKFIIKALHWITVLLSHQTIAVSQALLRELRWPGARRKMTVINPGRTIGVMYDKDAARRELISRFPILTPYQNDDWIGIVAELHPIKRHRILIDAVGQLRLIRPTIRLICIGDGSLHSDLSALIRARGLEQHVFLLGSVVEAARLLPAFTVMTLPSKSESYGYVLHEAGLARVPVVATAVGGISDIINHELSGLLVPPDDGPTLAAALNQTLVDSDRTQGFVQSLHTHLLERTVARMVTTTTLLYRP